MIPPVIPLFEFLAYSDASAIALSDSGVEPFGSELAYGLESAVAGSEAGGVDESVPSAKTEILCSIDFS